MLRSLRWVPVSLLVVAQGASAQAPSAPAERSATTTSTTLSRDGLATTTTEDCTDPSEVRCTRTTDASLGAGGVALSQTTERVVAVQQQPSGVTQSGFQLSMVLGSGENITILGGSFGAQVRMLSGSQFPGGAGGGWSGFFLEPSAAISVTSVETTTPRVCFGPTSCSGGTTETTTVGSAMLGASAGFQFMHFDEMDATSREQSGLGLALGVQAAATVPFEGGETSTSFGPVISLLRPSYNPGTARLETESLNLFVVPNDDLFLMVLGYAGSTN